jgi:hypothetical protein
MPTPTPHTRKAEIATQARAEARSLTSPGHQAHPGGALTAAALRTHGTLTAGLGQNVPFATLGPSDSGVRALTAFLAVYAAQQEAHNLGVAA